MTARTNTDLDRAIGQRIAAVRKGKNMTQTDLGRVLGVTFQQIQKYEKGTNRIAVSTLTRLCSALDLSPAEFFPRLMKDGSAAPDPFAALGASIGGYELAKVYSDLDPDARASILNIAKTIAAAKATTGQAVAA